jgi:hypothetical protein
VNKFIVLNWVVIVTALLYLHGLLSIEEQNQLLHTAESVTGPPSYQDILIRGYDVFLTLPVRPIMLLPSSVVLLFLSFSYILFSYPLPRRVTSRPKKTQERLRKYLCPALSGRKYLCSTAGGRRR